MTIVRLFCKLMLNLLYMIVKKKKKSCLPQIYIVKRSSWRLFFKCLLYIIVKLLVCVLSCLHTDSSAMPLGSSVHGILQATILEWVSLHSSRGSSQPRKWNCIFYVSCIGRQVLYQLWHLGSPIIKLKDNFFINFWFKLSITRRHADWN